MRLSLNTLVWLCVAAALIGFVSPWAKLDIRETHLEQSIVVHARKSLGKTFGAGARTAPKKPAKVLPVIPTRVTGAQIPELANRKNVRVVSQLVELFTTERQDIGWKSYAVYLVPGIALLCGILLTSQGEKRPVLIGTAALCLGIGGGGVWKLLATHAAAQFGIRIEWGLWLSLVAYLGLACAAVVSLFPER